MQTVTAADISHLGGHGGGSLKLDLQINGGQGGVGSLQVIAHFRSWLRIIYICIEGYSYNLYKSCVINSLCIC